jgi:hypothetical protein
MREDLTDELKQILPRRRSALRIPDKLLALADAVIE